MVQELPDEQDFDTALEHGLAILAALNAHGTSVNSAEGAALAGLGRADARRSLETLTALGYTGLDGHRYQLQPRTLRLGVSFMDSSGITTAIARVVTRLRSSLHARISAVVLDGDEAFYFPARNHRWEAAGCATGPQPASATSGGRVLLAFRGHGHRFESLRRLRRDRGKVEARPCTLPTIPSEIRREGIAAAFDDAGSVRSLAVPVFDEAHHCVCALELAASDMDLTLPALLSDVVSELLSVSRPASGRDHPHHPDACGDEREDVTWQRA
jgi:DNA-binding IclR family transcriptional regulator